MYCSPTYLFKKFQREVPDNELAMYETEKDEVEINKNRWNPTSKNP
jgi:hypothetical protein